VEAHRRALHGAIVLVRDLSSGVITNGGTTIRWGIFTGKKSNNHFLSLGRCEMRYEGKKVLSWPW
jgi:hypothetical protein